MFDRTLSNGRLLKILEGDPLNNVLSLSIVPYIVLLTAWNRSKAFPTCKFVENLLAKGTRHFLCAGDNSEELHDHIDDVLYKYEEKIGGSAVSDVVTTYHPDESMEDIVNFFVFSNELNIKEHNYMLAVLDSSNKNDMRIKEILLQT